MTDIDDLTTLDELLVDFAAGKPIRRKSWKSTVYVFYDYITKEFGRIDDEVSEEILTEHVPFTMDDLIADDWEIVEDNG